MTFVLTYPLAYMSCDKMVEYQTAGELFIALMDGTSTVFTERLPQTLSGYTTLGRFSDASYTAAGGDQAVTGLSTDIDTSTHRALLKPTPNVDPTWTSLSGPDVIGCLFYRFLGSDATSIPLLAYNGTGFPRTPTGSDFKVDLADALGVLETING